MMLDELKKAHEEGMNRLIDTNKMHWHIVDNPNAKPEHIAAVYKKHKDDPTNFNIKNTIASNWKTPEHILRDIHNRHASNSHFNRVLLNNINLPGDVVDYIDRYHGTKDGTEDEYTEEYRVTRIVAEHPNIRMDTAENILKRHGSTHEQINNRENLRIINNLHRNRNLPQEFRDKIKSNYKQHYEPNYKRFGPKNDPNEL